MKLEDIIDKARGYLPDPNETYMSDYYVFVKAGDPSRLEFMGIAPPKQCENRGFVRVRFDRARTDEGTNGRGRIRLGIYTDSFTLTVPASPTSTS